MEGEAVGGEGEAVALIEVHAHPTGYSASDTALHRSVWIGHQIDRTLGQPFYEYHFGTMRCIWPVVTGCGQRIGVILEPDWGFASERSCVKCKKLDRFPTLLIEVMPPLEKSWESDEVKRKARRQSGVSAAQAF